MKKLKNLLLAFVLMFSAVFLIGCGGPLDSEVTVDKSGTYSKVEATSVQSEVSVSKEIYESTVEGFKFSSTTKGSTGTTKNVAIIKFKDGKIYEAATKITMDLKIGDISSKSNIEAYLKDNCWYISANITGAGDGSVNFKYKFDATDESATEEYLESFNETLDSFSVDELLSANNEAVGSFTNGQFTYSKAVVNDIAKYKLALDKPVTATMFGVESTLEKFETFILIKDGCLNGFEATTKSKSVIGELTTTSETHIGLAPYSGTISYPSFDAYTEAPAI